MTKVEEEDRIAYDRELERLKDRLTCWGAEYMLVAKAAMRAGAHGSAIRYLQYATQCTAEAMAIEHGLAHG